MRASLWLDADALLAEGPVWDETAGDLIWVDILRGEIHRTRLDTSHDTTIPLYEHVGAVAMAEDGNMIAACASGFRSVDGSGATTLLSQEPVVPGLVRMNDGKCDPRGRFVAGTMAYNERRGAGALWSFDGHVAKRLFEGVTISNGLAWSLDGETMYYVDTATQRIDALDYDLELGLPKNRRPYISIDPALGHPDGITIDADGGLWVALWNGSAVHRYDGTQLSEVISVPTHLVTSCAFGGQDMQDLYITTANDQEASSLHGGGALYHARPGPRGLYAARHLPMRQLSPEEERPI